MSIPVPEDYPTPRAWLRALTVRHLEAAATAAEVETLEQWWALPAEQREES